ncbi:PIN domain-containing protein [Myxacorys almedinensis]|uniref:PIN domain-containing protein n=1 Tax=Myxacorys almedinensis TaxID=2651157 RepID=UPI003B75B8CB
MAERAQELESSNNIKSLDALHIACAEALDVNYLMTCDDRLIKKYSGRFTRCSTRKSSSFLMAKG